jgi:hypothetical protein
MINIKSLLGLDYYTSGLDNFLAEFDKTHPKLSKSQLAEKQKYARIYKLRSDPNYHEKKEDFWDKY